MKIILGQTQNMTGDDNSIFMFFGKQNHIEWLNWIHQYHNVLNYHANYYKFFCVRKVNIALLFDVVLNNY